jgi:Tfp pilus assembly protein PilO
MVFRPFSSREKSIFIVCLTVVGFYLLYHFGYQQIKEDIVAQQGLIVKSQKDLRKYNQTLRGEEVIRQKLKHYEDLFKQQSSDEGEMTRILSDIEAIAQKGSIKIVNMQPGRIKKQDFYNYFSVNVQAQSSLKNIVAFLYDLEAPPHLFHIDEMRIEKHSLQAEDLKCQFVISRFLFK